MTDRSKSGFVFDDRYLQHNPGFRAGFTSNRQVPFVDPDLHPSNHRLVMRTKHLVDLSGVNNHLMRISPRLATEDEVAAYHTNEYIERVQTICAEGGGDTGEGALAGPGSYEIALLSAGGGLAGVDAVVSGEVGRVFANIRPPGHHAMSDKGMGFCIFNNVVIAARYAQRVHGIKRVMILDWDVHDGNGTQDAFYADPSVLFFSLHQNKLYPPGFGELEQSGRGEGEGFTVNLPLPAGSGDATYRAAFERVVLPIANEFAPELVLISAGQDASTMDPLGRMCLSTEAYRQMTRWMMQLAQDHAEGRLVILQEGGYSESYAPYCTLAIVATLAGQDPDVPEPLSLEHLQERPEFSEVGPTSEAALDAIRSQHARYWECLR